MMSQSVFISAEPMTTEIIGKLLPSSKDFGQHVTIAKPAFLKALLISGPENNTQSTEITRNRKIKFSVNPRF